MLAAGAQQAPTGGGEHHLFAPPVEPQVSFEHAHVHVRICPDPLPTKPRGLTRSGCHDTLARLRGARQRTLAKPVRALSLKAHQQVDAVEQRTAETPAMPSHLAFAAVAATA